VKQHFDALHTEELKADKSYKLILL